jgi:hypothetical protein
MVTDSRSARRFYCSMALCYGDGGARPAEAPPDVRPALPWYPTIGAYAAHIREVHRLAPHAAPPPWGYEQRPMRERSDGPAQLLVWVRVFDGIGEAWPPVTPAAEVDDGD